MSISAGGCARSCAQTPPDKVVDAEAVHALRSAYDGARWILGRAAQTEEWGTRLAQLVIEAATTGERDPWRLRTDVLRSFT